MPQQDFNAAERQAIQRAREMYSRASPRQEVNEPVFRKQPSPPPPPPPAQIPPPPKEPPPQRQASLFSSFGKGFDGDMKLIIAMMLLLSGEGGDTLLLLALIYIML